MKSLVLLAAVCLVAIAPTARAQEVRASLGGRVTDAQGALVPNAKVTVTSEDTNVEQHAATNDSGNWVVKFLLPGHYHFSVMMDGFKTTDRKGIVLQTADDKTVDVQLAVGAMSQSVDVTGEAPLIDTTTATSGTVINEREMTELPTISRVPTLMAILSPGVVQQDQNNNPIHGWSYNGASQIEVNGGRYSTIYANFYTIDGFPNVKSGGNIAFIPSQDLIGEFRVQLSAYDASIGRQAGGTFNMTSKSGTKDFHGSLYEFNQNNFLNARQFQLNLTNAVNPPIHLNQWGFTFGGPAWIPKLYNGRKKTFFFIHYEGLRNKNPQGGLLSLPTQAERMGDFSQSYTSQVVAGQRTSVPYTIYDPLTIDAGGNRAPFPNAQIPQQRINPISQSILKYISLPNQPSDGTSTDSNNYVSPAFRQDKMAVFSARGDQQWSDTQRSFLVMRWDTNSETQGNNFGTPAGGTAQVRTPKQVGVDHIWTASANKILDLRFVVNRYEEETQDQGTGFSPTTLGFSPAVAAQFRYPQFPQIGGIGGAATSSAQAPTRTT